MSEVFLECPQCSWRQRFAQHHPEPGQCPDAPDGSCPEWYCTTCGTALLTGFPHVPASRPRREPVGASVI